MHSGHMLQIVFARLRRQQKWTHHSRFCLLTLVLTLLLLYWYLDTFIFFHYVRRDGSLNPSPWVFADKLRLKC